MPLDHILRNGSILAVARRLVCIGRLIKAQTEFDRKVLESLDRIDAAKRLQKRGRKVRA